ncbi:response regulator transcription factor [Pyrinomonas methylaliphatogenes]|jgi:DNA-binding response OmpR family regulator|nr:response regulator [Pyrinomonas methylaliphatogenes]MBX5480035.1 response regulator [Pyrinomonas methylaliphatogenes]
MMKDVADRKTVLFVDDTADTRDLVTFSLSREGFNVVTAQTAEEGLALAHRGEFALILLDIGLPDMDGLELCREIRRFDQQTPILFYTAFADLLDHEEAKRAGAQGCLRKPEDTSRLAQVARMMVGK